MLLLFWSRAPVSLELEADGAGTDAGVLNRRAGVDLSSAGASTVDSTVVRRRHVEPVSAGSGAEVVTLGVRRSMPVQAAGAATAMARASRRANAIVSAAGSASVQTALSRRTSLQLGTVGSSSGSGDISERTILPLHGDGTATTTAWLQRGVPLARLEVVGTGESVVALTARRGLRPGGAGDSGTVNHVSVRRRMDVVTAAGSIATVHVSRRATFAPLSYGSSAESARLGRAPLLYLEVAGAADAGASALRRRRRMDLLLSAGVGVEESRFAVRHELAFSADAESEALFQLARRAGLELEVEGDATPEALLGLRVALHLVAHGASEALLRGLRAPLLAQLALRTEGRKLVVSAGREAL